MLDWLTTPPGPDGGLPTGAMALRLLLAAGFGFAVATIYFVTQRKQRREAAPFVATLVLLTILLAMVSMVIGSNIARAFSLVGALAIVRFRTVVEDTRDTAFVIFAVVSGLASGAGAYEVPAIGTPLIAFVAWFLRVWGGGGSPRPTANTLLVRLGIGADPNGPLTETLTRHVSECRLVTAATARQGAALDLTYTLVLKEKTAALTLIADLNRVEGIQSVEWTERKSD